MWHSLSLAILFGRLRGGAAGWAGNSKYAFWGRCHSTNGFLRKSLALAITILLCAGSLNLSAIVEAQKRFGLQSLYYLCS